MTYTNFTDNNKNFEDENDNSLYFEYAKYEQENQLNKLRETLKAVSQVDGDKAGEIQRFKQQFNLPDDFELEDNEETFQYIRNKQKEDYLLQQNFARINPILARQLEDPKFAALAHDNIEHLQEYYTKTRALTAVPRFIKNEAIGLPQGIHKGWLTNERGLLGYQLMMGDENTPYAKNDKALKFIAADIFGALRGPESREDKLARIEEIDKIIGQYDADGTGWLEAGGYYFGQFGRTLPAAATTGLVTSKINAKLGAMFGTIGGPKGTLLGGVLGATTGFGAAYNYMALNSYMVEGGSSYLDAIQREGGLNPEDAKVQAQFVGLLAAGVERVGLPFLTGPLKRNVARSLVGAKGFGSNQWLQGSLKRSGLDQKLRPVWKMFNKRILRQATKESLNDKFERITRTSVSRNFFADIAQNILTENATELTQEFINIFGYNIAAELSRYNAVPIEAEEIGERVRSVISQTTKGMLTFGLATSGGGYYQTVNKLNESKSDQKYIEQIIDLSKNDKTLKRNKNVWQEYMNLVGDRNGIKDFYIDAETFQQQLNENDITDEQLELFSPEINKQLKNAQKEGLIGKTIKIQTGDYLADIAGTELHNILRPHLRGSEDGYSQQEFIQVNKMKDEMLGKVLEDVKQNEAEFQESKRQANAFRQQIENQLKTTNLYNPDVARAISNLPLEFAIAYSKRSNMSIQDFLNKYLYTVQFEGKPKTFGEEFFNQDGSIKTESTLFKNWFGKSKMVNDDGTPMVLYHGTTDSFDRFDISHPHRYDTGFVGKGIYLTLNKGHAAIYARQKGNRFNAKAKDRKVLSLYVRLENPFRETDQDIKRKLREGGAAAALAYTEKLKRAGHDGVLKINPTTNEITEVVVFDPNAVKSVDNKGSWSREVDNIYEQQQLETFEQRGKQKKGKPVPQAVYQVANLIESFDFAEKNVYETNRNFKLALQKRVNDEAKKAGIDLSQNTIERDKYLVQTVLADARYALSENDNAIGWYDTTLTKAKAVIALIHPELISNPESNFAFVYALANTSNMIKVDKNLELAEQAYTYWKENGEFPTNIGIGDAAQAINRNFKLYNRLIKEKGFAELENYLKTMHSVKEIEAYTNDEVSGLNKTDMAYGAAVMGPKIGNGFFANLYGNYEQLTMDRWLIRSWGRITGTLVLDYKRQAKVKRGQLKELIKALSLQEKKLLSEIIGIKIKLSDLDNVAVAIQRASTSDAKRKRMNEIATIVEKPERKQFLLDLLGKPQKRYPHISLGGEIRKGGNALAKYNDGQKEAPSGAPERRNIINVFEQVLAELQQTEKDLTMADLQALLWYPEKRLYDSAKLDADEIVRGYEESEAPDYANASVNLAKQLGVAETDIQTTLEEVTNVLERKATERATDSERGERGDGGIRETNTFQQQGRIDETTGLPLNADGTVTVYHHTNRRAAERIRATGELRSAGEPDVYVTTRAITDTGYGDTAVTIRVNPSRLSLDDEFPNGRRDFRLSVGKPRGSIQVNVGEFLEQNRSEKGPRGRFDPSSFTTLLNSESDISTFFHETGHYMLSVMEDIVMQPDPPQGLVDDFNVLLDFFGVKDMETWSKLSMSEKKEFHESFALNFEIYIHEGKAPSQGLKKIFNDFQRWISKVYENIKFELNKTYKELFGKDLPVLTDEVRSVMDRMLAADEEITLANEIYGMKAMFQTQEQSGMNDAEWAEYQAQLQEALDESIAIFNQKTMRQVRWLNNARGNFMKEIQKKNKATYKKLEAEITQQVQNEKTYRLQNYLKRGETINDQGEIVKVKSGYKLSKASIQRLIPFYDMAAEIKQLGTNKFGMVAQQGQDVETVAEMFGYDDALQMINALLDLRPIKQVIAERTEQRMLDEFSDLTDPRQIELQLQEALHSEARARFISAELKFLSKSTQPVRLQVAAAKEAARDILANTKLSDIRPSEYTRNEARARKQTEEAMKKDDMPAAIAAKRAQLIQNQLAKQAIEIHKEYDKVATKKDALFRKFLRTDSKLTSGTTSRNINLINAGRAILSTYGIQSKRIDVQENLRQLKEYNEYVYEQLEPIILKAQANENQITLEDLTASEFADLTDIMKTLWHQSLREEQVRKDNKLIAKAKAIAPLITRMKTIISRNKTLQERQANPPGKAQAIKSGFDLNKFILTTGANLQRMESFVDDLDGADEIKPGFGSAVLQLKSGKLGDFYNTLFYPVKEALNQYREQQLIFTKEYTELVRKLNFDQGKITAYEFDAVSEDSVPYTFGIDADGRGKVELLGAMLHTGNNSNLKKLLLGRGWGSLNEDGTLNTTHWDAFVDRIKREGYLTKTDYDFLQAVWDLNERMKPLLQKAHFEIEGFYFKEVKATPIINEFGEYRGGYVPAKGDPKMSDQVVEITVEQLAQEFRLSLPMVENGMTKERNENFAQPLSLNLGYMTKHIDDSLRYSYVQPVVKDVLKIVNDKEFANTLKIINPSKMDNLIKPWLHTVVSQKTFAPSRLGQDFDRTVTTVRKNGGIAVMFFNLMNAVQQYTGVFPAMLKAKPSHMMESLQTFIKDRQGSMQMIADLSPFMADRQLNQIFDIQDRLNQLLINPNNFSKFKDWSTKHAYFLQQTFQNQTDAVVWMAVYNQTHQDLPTNMSDAEVQREAIKQADAAVRMTQDSLLPEDRAGFQNWDPIMQSIMQFTGYFNTMANLNHNQYKKIVNDIGFTNKGARSEQLFYMYLYSIMMPAILAGVISRSFSGNLFVDENDNESILDDMALTVLGDIIDYKKAFVPVIGNALLIPINQFDNKPWNDSIVSSPSIELLTRGVQKTARIPFRIQQGEGITGRDIRDISALVTIISGIPVTPIGKTSGYLLDVSQGEVNPENAIDLIRGAVTGKASQASRK